MSVGGGGGGGISCPGASSTVVFDENWANPTQIHTTGIHEQDVVVVRFTPTGANTVGYNFSQISAGTGDQTNRTTVLSPTACDFSTPPVLQWNAWQNGNTATTLFSIGPNNIGYPALTAGTTYYLNIKNSPGTCPGGCDMYIQLNATSH